MLGISILPNCIGKIYNISQFQNLRNRVNGDETNDKFELR